jgi:hypothetical protein
MTGWRGVDVGIRTRFNGPTSVCQKAASGESLARAGSACPNLSSTVATEPGWTV